MKVEVTPGAGQRSERRTRPWVLIVAALAAIVAGVAIAYLPSQHGVQAISGALALFAAIGVFCILLYGFGLLEFSEWSSSNRVVQAIVDESDDGYVVTDENSRIVYSNPAYRRLTGGAAVRQVEKSFSGSPEVSEATYRLAQAARGRQAGAEEVRLATRPNGADGPAWFRLRVRPLKGVSLQALTLWSVADLTRERASHESFFQDLQRAIDYLDHAPAGFFSVDPDGAIAHINATLAMWLGLDIAQFQPGQLLVADIVSGGGRALLSSVSGKPGEVVTRQIDVDMKPRAGRPFPVRLLHRVSFASDGRPGSSRTLAVRADAADAQLKDAEAAESRFFRLFTATPIGIATVALDGAVLMSNPAFDRLAPSTLAEAKGASRKTLLDAVAERDRAAVEAAIREAHEGRDVIVPVEAALEGDPQRSARFYISAPESQTGSDAAAMLFAIDTTEQRTLQESFAQSQKMQAIGQLAGGVAHDFNNVLTAIIGYSDLLLANHRPTDPSFQDIMQIKQNANRAAGLVRQLLAFSRRQTLRPQVIQLGEVISDLYNLLARLVGETIKLEVVYGRDLWLVRADLNQFEQVVVNLVVNARDAIKDGGQIFIRTRNVTPEECARYNEKALPVGEYVLVEVEDSGHGIPADVLDKIFEPFFTTKEIGKGTGLGLSMVYGIVKQTGGFVFCESEVGKGTTFRVFLPRHIRGEAEETAKKEVAKPAADLTGRGAILLVEDEEAVRAFASRALASRGYTVLQAESGVDALRVVEENKGQIDLIVSDVIMPEMDGPTMLIELRKRGVQAKIVFVSGYADDAFAKSLPEGQEFLFLPKPFTLKQLIETVKTANS